MASYTDAITQFNPYVQQLPVELMMKVGMQKQAQYDAGVQKIQQSIDNVAGLEIDKEGHKQYLQSKLGELGNKLRTVAGGDFSNQQLVNSVSGMAGTLIKDPIIRNAVYSTQKLRKGTAEIEAARKKGDLTPQNKYMFDLAANKYLNDPDLEARFDGSYEQFFDPDKYASEVFSKVTKGKIKWEDLYERNTDGSLKLKPIVGKGGKVVGNVPVLSKTMKTHLQEGILPDVVKKTIDQIMRDPRVSRQLEINGTYAYRGLDGENLREMAIDQKDYLLEKANDKLKQLYIDKATGKDVKQEMEMVQQSIENITSRYDELAQIALKNPDAVKGRLTKDFFVDNTTAMYGTMTHEIDTDENPEWRALFDETKEANDIAMKQADMRLRATLSANEIASREKIAKASRQTQIAIAQIRGSKGAGEMIDSDDDGIPDTFIPGDGTGGGGGLIPEKDENPGDIGTYMSKWTTENDESAAALTNTQDNLLWYSTFSGVPAYKKVFDNYISSGISKDQAISQTINYIGKNQPGGVAKMKADWTTKVVTSINKMTPAELAKRPALLDAKNAYDNAKSNFTQVKSFADKLSQNVEKSVGKAAYEAASLKNLKPVKGSYKGKEFTLAPQDQLDLALYIKGYHSTLYDTSGVIDKGVRSAADNAAQRLSAKGLGFMLDYALHRSTDAYRGYAKTLFDPVTDLVRMGQRWKGSAMSGFSKLATGEWGNPNVDLDPIMKLTENLDTEAYSKVFKETEKMLQAHYNVNPNLKLPVLGQEPKANQALMRDLRRLASNATEAGKNLSPDLDGFAKALEEEGFGINNGSIEAKIINGASNTPMVEIVAGTPSGGRLGGMVVTMDVAKNLGLNIEGIYEPTEIRLLKNLINQRGGQSSVGDPTDKRTYRNNDVQFPMTKFPQLSQFSGVIDVKGNIIQRNGKYYGQIYVTDNKGNEILRETPGHESLQKAQNTLLSMNINNINMLINER